jgi:hypothetical protein
MLDVTSRLQIHLSTSDLDGTGKTSTCQPSHLRFRSRKGHMFVGLNIEEPHARPISERSIPLYHHRSSIIILVILVGGFKHDWIISIILVIHMG